MNTIEARGLIRFYGGTRGVAGLDLDVPEGTVMGLLGLNGSGKTTAIKLLLGHLVPNSGTVRVWGEDPVELYAATRSRIAYVADEAELPHWMTLKEGMELYASYFPQWNADNADDLIKRFALPMDQRFSTLSKGQKRRFFLCLAVAQQPDLLVLDEPAGGLDPVIRRDFLDLLMELRSARDVTILLSSHILSDVERIVDRVAFIHEGKCLLQDELETLKSRVKRLCIKDEAAKARIRARFDVISTRTIGDTTQIHVSNFQESKLEGIHCSLEQLNLEDIFLAYNGEQSTDAVRQR